MNRSDPNKEIYKNIKKHHLELAISTHKAEQKKNKNKQLKFIDLFAGIGGIRQAFESAGGQCVFSSDIDIFAQCTYFKNFGVVPYGDIKQFKENNIDIPDHNILCAGFPCQPFSHIGKREGFRHPTQGTMFHEILKILEEKSPNVVFLENVPGIVNHDNRNTLKTILSELENIGYLCSTTIYNAGEFAIPQNRKRFYLVGVRKKTKFKFSPSPNMIVNIGDYVEKDVQGYTISKHLQKSYMHKVQDGRPNLINSGTKGPAKTLVSTYHKIQRLTGTFVEGGETGMRLLTENECKAMMGFPSDFVFPVSRTQMYRQLGNSVALPVVKLIAKDIANFIRN